MRRRTARFGAPRGVDRNGGEHDDRVRHHPDPGAGPDALADAHRHHPGRQPPRDPHLPHQAGPARAASHQRAAGGPAPGQAHRTGRAVVRRHVVLGLRHRADAAHPDPRGRGGRLLIDHAPHRRDPRGAGRCHHLLPRRRPLLPQGGRLLRRKQGQLRPQRGPDSRRRPAHQLHHHGGGVGGGRGRRHRVGRPRPEARRGPALHRVRRSPRLREPPGYPRGGAGLRRPHLLLHRQYGDPHRDGRRARRRGAPRACAQGRPHPPPRACRRRLAAGHLRFLPAPSLRQRELGHDRDRGHLQRRQHLPRAPGPQCPYHPRPHEHHPRGDVPGRVGSRRAQPPRALHPGRAHRAVGDRPSRVRVERGRADPLLRAAGGHGAHPHPGRQHQLHRLPLPSRASWPRTPSCPANSPCGGTGSCSPTASSCSPPPRSRCSSPPRPR